VCDKIGRHNPPSESIDIESTGSISSLSDEEEWYEPEFEKYEFCGSNLFSKNGDEESQDTVQSREHLMRSDDIVVVQRRLQ
jgi:hypothetical protein